MSSQCFSKLINFYIIVVIVSCPASVLSGVCPSICTCTEHSSSLSYVIRCDERNLTSTPLIDDVQQLDNVTYIDLFLNENYISHLIASALSPFRGKLRSLEMENNRKPILISPTVVDMFEESLEVLKVDNSAVDVNEALLLFSPLSRLRVLRISSSRQGYHVTLNRIKTLDGNTKPLMEFLKSIELNDCGIRDMAEDSLYDFPSLESLNLAHNRLIHIPRAIEHLLMTTLQELNLKDNSIMALQASDFPFLCKLRSLNLKNNKLFHIAPYTLGKCPMLRNVMLSGNVGLTVSESAILSGSCNLSLDIMNTGIQTLNHISVSNVKRVVFGGAAFHCRCQTFVSYFWKFGHRMKGTCLTKSRTEIDIWAFFSECLSQGIVDFLMENNTIMNRTCTSEKKDALGITMVPAYVKSNVLSWYNVLFGPEKDEKTKLEEKEVGGLVDNAAPQLSKTEKEHSDNVSLKPADVIEGNQLNLEKDYVDIVPRITTGHANKHAKTRHRQDIQRHSRLIADNKITSCLRNNNPLRKSCVDNVTRSLDPGLGDKISRLFQRLIKELRSMNAKERCEFGVHHNLNENEKRGEDWKGEHRDKGSMTGISKYYSYSHGDILQSSCIRSIRTIRSYVEGLAQKLLQEQRNFEKCVNPNTYNISRLNTETDTAVKAMRTELPNSILSVRKRLKRRNYENFEKRQSCMRLPETVYHLPYSDPIQETTKETYTAKRKGLVIQPKSEISSSFGPYGGIPKSTSPTRPRKTHRTKSRMEKRVECPNTETENMSLPQGVSAKDKQTLNNSADQRRTAHWSKHDDEINDSKKDAIRTGGVTPKTKGKLRAKTKDNSAVVLSASLVYVCLFAAVMDGKGSLKKKTTQTIRFSTTA